MQPVRRLRLEPAFHEVGPAARAPRRFGGDGRPAAATPRIPDSRMTFITWSRPISAGSQPRANNWACVLRYPYTAMKESAWISRMSRG